MSGFDWTTLFGDKLVSKSGEVSTKTALDGKKKVAIYFSAHWCPPCRGFTPVLKAAYEKGHADIEVVFVSSDRDEASFKEYYGEMADYLALPYSQREAKEELAKKFGVRGIPMLVVLDEEGNVSIENARGKVAEANGKGLDEAL